MDGVGISIIERTQPLHGHDTPSPTPAPSHAKSSFPHLDSALLRLHDGQPRVGEDRRGPPSASGTDTHDDAPSHGLVKCGGCPRHDEVTQPGLVLLILPSVPVRRTSSSRRTSTPRPRARRAASTTAVPVKKGARISSRSSASSRRALHGDLRCHFFIPGAPRGSPAREQTHRRA